jgi:uncharacterized protein (TIGR00369 family)
MQPAFIAETPADLPDMETLLGLSGLEFMQAVLSGKISGPPIAGLLNYHLDLVEQGRVVFRGAPKFAASNPMGTVHGGWYGTLLDSCMACAVMTTVPKGSVYTTLEYKINITRPIPLGCEVLAEGRIQHAGRSTGVANGELRGVEDGKLYATGSTTCIIMEMPAATSC